MSIQTSKKADRALGVVVVGAENILEDVNNLGGSTTKKLSDEPERPAFSGHVCGVSESGACQTGKQNERGRTHVQRVCVARRLSRCLYKKRKSVLSTRK
jgi:hypothetical protein